MTEEIWEELGVEEWQWFFLMDMFGNESEVIEILEEGRMPPVYRLKSSDNDFKYNLAELLLRVEGFRVEGNPQIEKFIGIMCRIAETDEIMYCLENHASSATHVFYYDGIYYITLEANNI